jgi:hypothetical protein
MADPRLKDLDQQGNFLFNKKMPLHTLWQDIAENFYVERADFTVIRSLSDSFADNLTTSYPLIARRDLGNMFSSMLRPTDKQWFYLRPTQELAEDNEALRWVEWATQVQTRAMYDPEANFVRAMKEADHDFAAFGQAVISVELNKRKSSLLYRTWHLRDVAWCEGPEGKIDTVYRNFMQTAKNLTRLFPDKCHANVVKLAEKEPYKEIKCRHVVIPSDQYNGGKDAKGKDYRFPFMSVYYDCENMHIMEEVPSRTLKYVIPRWQTVPGSQYAYSPATVAALPDARLIQAMTLTLLEAGEKAANPPMLAVQEAIRSDISIFAGGITWVDGEYDGKLEEVLRPLSQDTSGLPLGVEMQRDIRMSIAEAFYLNKINLPPPTKEMTAFETSQRVSEYVRQALPLFEPMEQENNAATCEMTFDELFYNGAFGSPDMIPESLRGSELNFTFESPLSVARESQQANKFVETKALLLEAAALDPTSIKIMDVQVALRDALKSVTPTKWIRSEREMAQIQEQDAQTQQAAQAMAGIGGAAQVAEQVGKAGQALQATEEQPVA